MEFDDVMNLLGPFGKYQRIVYFIVCLVGLPFAFNNMGIVFLAGKTDYWCAVPTELKNTTLTQDQLKNLTLPLEKKDGKTRYSQCRMYDLNLTGWDDDQYETHIANRNTSLLSKNAIICSDVNGWYFDKSVYTNTIVMQWDLVCDTRRWLASTAASVYMAGLCFGVVFFGGLSDWWGRRKTLFLTVVIGAVFNVVTAFSPNIYVFYVLRFFIALCTASTFTIGFVIGVELVGPSWRVFTGVFVQFYWTGGYLLVAAFAYGIRDWFTLQLVLSTGFFACFIFFCTVPESARWLYSKGRREEGEEILRKAAKVNGQTLPDKLDIEVKKDIVSKPSIIDLVRTPRIRMNSLNVFFQWFGISMVYYGLSLNTSNLGGDDFINFAIAAAVELPANAICLVILQFFGRRIPLCASLVLAGAALLATLAVPAHLNVVAIVLAMIGKFSIAISFVIIYVFSAEVFPTVVRNVGVGAGSFWARVGGAVAPYIAQLSDFNKIIPLVIFGVLSLVCALVTLALPETMGVNLPQTIEEGEQFGRKPKKAIQNKPTAEDQGRTNPVFTVELQG